MRFIKNIKLRQILDSRGFPTIQCEIIDSNNILFKSSSPSGASTGQREAIELRDGGTSFMGKGVINALKKQNILQEVFINKELKNTIQGFLELDELLLKIDNTMQKNIIGGNVSTAVSFCLLKAVSNNNVWKLWGKNKIPRPFVNIINGGKHAGNKLKIQEFMIVPAETDNIYKMLDDICRVYHNLKKIIEERYGNSQTSVGDEGGYAPDIENPEEALQLLVDAIKETDLIPGKDMSIALDCAASEYYTNNKYEIKPNLFLTSDEVCNYLVDLCNKFPIISLEDPFDENDFNAWIKLNNMIGSKCMIVGDDLFTTSPEYCKKGVLEKWANSLLVKVNQIGTISEALQSINIFKENNGKIIVSHRSGETNDDIIVDLGVGVGADFVKIGAPCRGERISKYNRLIEIFDK